MGPLHGKKDIERHCLHPELSGNKRSCKLVEMTAWAILAAAIAALLLVIAANVTEWML